MKNTTVEQWSVATSKQCTQHFSSVKGPKNETFTIPENHSLFLDFRRSTVDYQGRPMPAWGKEFDLKESIDPDLTADNIIESTKTVTVCMNYIMLCSLNNVILV